MMVLSFALFVIVGALGTFVVTPIGCPLAAAFAGYLAAEVVHDGGTPARTAGNFFFPLWGVLVGIAGQLSFVPVLGRHMWYLLGVCAVTYTISNAVSLLLGPQGRWHRP